MLAKVEKLDLSISELYSLLTPYPLGELISLKVLSANSLKLTPRVKREIRIRGKIFLLILNSK